MNPGCTLIAFLKGKPEKREELLSVLRGFADYENWRTRNDLEEHFEMPYLKSFFDRRMDLLEKEIDMQYMTMDSAYDR